MIEQKKIEGFVDEILAGTDKFIVEVVVQPSNRITVFLDGDSGITIADCQAVSRKLEEKLHRDVVDFELNVSSPGLDKPLQIPRQYRKNIGRQMEIKLLTGEQFTGILARADENSVELEHPVKNPKKEIRKPNTIVELDKIKTAKIIISFGK